LLFNTLTYAWFFVAVFVVAWLLAPWRRLRLGFLLVSSYVFYAGWTFVGWDRLLAAHGAERAWLAFQSIKYVPLIFVGTSIDYWLGVALGKVQRHRLRKLLLVGTLLVNIGILVFFKYWNWGADTFLWVAEHAFGVKLPDISYRVELPIGISFFCFMSLSYVIDVYRGTISYCRSYLSYLTYISFFPHLVAGPIIRGRDLLPYLERDPVLTTAVAGEGLFLIACGLVKKVAIGDYLGLNLVDRVYADPSSFSAL
jgi:alginate O-acetyltransferase complex protein AlgI